MMEELLKRVTDLEKMVAELAKWTHFVPEVIATAAAIYSQGEVKVLSEPVPAQLGLVLPINLPNVDEEIVDEIKIEVDDDEGGAYHGDSDEIAAALLEEDDDEDEDTYMDDDDPFADVPNQTLSPPPRTGVQEHSSPLHPVERSSASTNGKKRQSYLIKKITSSGEVLSEERKKDLAREVQKYPAIWQTTYPTYMKKRVTVSSWRSVAKAVELTVEECKEQWKKLKDALRYQIKSRSYRIKKIGGQSGDSGAEGDNNDGDIQTLEAWTFWEDLKFLHFNNLNQSTTSNLDGHKRSLSSCHDANMSAVKRRREVTRGDGISSTGSYASSVN